MKRSLTTESDGSQGRNPMAVALREHEKIIKQFAEEFSFAPNIDRVLKSTANLTNAHRLNEARHRHEHHQTRSRLNTLTNGQIERWIYASDDAEMKAFFRHVWRDDPRGFKEPSAKHPRNSSGTPPATPKIQTQVQEPREKGNTAPSKPPGA